MRPLLIRHLLFILCLSEASKPIKGLMLQIPRPTQGLSTSTSFLFAPSPLSTSNPQTPIPSVYPTVPPSASPITSWSLTSCFSSSTSKYADRSATSFVPPRSTVTVTVIVLSTVRPRPSSSCTMSDTGIITLGPIAPTTSSQSGLSTSTPDIISSTPFVIPVPPSLPSTFLSPIPSTSDFPSPTVLPYPSISAISLSGISTDDTTITPTSTLDNGETIMVSSAVETGVLSTNTPHNASFAHQTGAIIGVTLAGSFVLLFVVLLIFFACKRRQWNRSYSSSMEDILAVSPNNSWRPPLDGDDEYLGIYGLPTSPNYTKTPGSQRHGEGGFFGDRFSSEKSRSGNVDVVIGASLVRKTLRDQLPILPVSQTLHGSTNSRDLFTSLPHSSSDGYYDSSRPRWENTQPLNIHKHNNTSQPPLNVDSHVSAGGSQSARSLGLGSGSSSDGYHTLDSSGETHLPSSIAPIHRPSGRSHYSTPVLARDSSLAHRIQREQEEQDRSNKRISQAILARLRASRIPGAATIVRAYSHSTTIRSEEVSPSRAPSSLLNPISMSETVPLPRGVTGSSHTPHNMFNQNSHHHREGVGDTFEGLWPRVTLPPTPSPVPTDTSSMVEGLLDPRLGMGLSQSQQASAVSFRDDRDYGRRLVHKETFETQVTVDSGEGII